MISFPPCRFFIRAVSFSVLIAVSPPVIAAEFRPTASPVLQLDYPTPTADKPQSKLWFMDGSWWALLPRASGPSLWQRTDGGWVEHMGVNEALRGVPGRADVWPDEHGITAVALTSPRKENPSATVFRLTYRGDGDGGRWEAAVLAELLPPAADKRLETATLLQDAAGVWWVGAVAGTEVCVWTAPPEASKWSGPVVLGGGTDPDDICVVTPLPDKQIGVIWSDQIREGFLMRAHTDGTGVDGWREEQGIQLGGRIGDDHLNTVLAPGGTLWLATKNSVDLTGKAQFTLFERSPAGAWQTWPFGILTETTRPSRPIVVASADGAMVLVGYGNRDQALPPPHGARIVFSRVDPENPDRVAPPRTVIAPDQALNSRIQNVTGPRHPYPADGPWIVLASDQEGRVYEADLRAAFLE